MRSSLDTPHPRCDSTAPVYGYEYQRNGLSDPEFNPDDITKDINNNINDDVKKSQFIAQAVYSCINLDRLKLMTFPELEDEHKLYNFNYQAVNRAIHSKVNSSPQSRAGVLNQIGGLDKTNRNSYQTLNAIQEDEETGISKDISKDINKEINTSDAPHKKAAFAPNTELNSDTRQLLNLAIHESNIRQLYSDLMIRTQLNEAKEQIDAMALNIGIPFDEQVEVITTLPLNFRVKGERVFRPRSLCCMILRLHDTNRYFIENTEYSREKFYKYLSIKPCLNVLAEQFLIQEEHRELQSILSTPGLTHNIEQYSPSMRAEIKNNIFKL